MEMLRLVLLLSLLTLCCGQEGCQISVDLKTGDLGDPQPLILNGSSGILYPNKEGILSFPTGQQISLACPGKSNGFNLPLEPKQIVEAVCIQRKEFEVDEESHSFNTFTCTKKTSKSEVRRKGSCLDDFSLIEIGFRMAETFIPVIEICRDDITDESYYAKSILSASIGGSQENVGRPSWVTLNLFNHKDINSFYTKKHQEETLEMILDSDDLAREYLKRNQLVRGHLAPKADFVYGSQQNSTFTFANAAPQWSSFNGGNWVHVEKAIRNFVVQNDLKVVIYTGVHGQMTLKDKNEQEQPIHLGIDENNNRYMRVPKFFWKIMYIPARRQALAIVGVNDPFREKITEDMFLCEDISNNPNVAWLTESWGKRMDIPLGASYVCQYEGLKKVVNTVPDLKVVGIINMKRKTKIRMRGN